MPSCSNVKLFLKEPIQNIMSDLFSSACLSLHLGLKWWISPASRGRTAFYKNKSQISAISHWFREIALRKQYDTGGIPFSVVGNRTLCTQLDCLVRLIRFAASAVVTHPSVDVFRPSFFLTFHWNNECYSRCNIPLLAFPTQLGTKDYGYF
jgi:hypothetical protein